MAEDHVARASTTIHASAQRIWQALTDPAIIKQYMFGTTVASEWKEGSPITWKGEWQGKPYEDTGEILKLIPNRLLRYTHDSGNDHHTVTVDLSESGDQTHVALSQDGNATDEARQHSEKNWTMMLEGLKKVVEQR